MRKKLLFLMLLGSLAAAAQETVLVVAMADGTRTTFRLEERPVMTLDGGDCVFRSESKSIIVARERMADFHFEESSDGIEAVKGADVDVRFEGDVLRISGVEPGRVKVFDVQGKAARAEIQGEKDGLTVSLQRLPQGVYVVGFEGNTIKILKK